MKSGTIIIFEETEAGLRKWGDGMVGCPPTMKVRKN